ncbi:hypothetical protein GB937_009560 [Aspergillus fischeri]|jgi:hypothetical protein|nr:hypothetical protein GB937_009560 [Aspergillus fischeri]
MSEQADRSAAEQKRIEQNQLTLMSLSSGEEAKRARGKKTEMPSERIANNPNLGQVVSSGEEAQKRRKKKD